MSAMLKTYFKEKIVKNIEIPILTKCCFCVPLRRGLIFIAYVNLVLILLLTTALLVQVSRGRTTEASQEEEDIARLVFPRMIVDSILMILELITTIVFIVALHMKHVLLMKIYLYFDIFFSIFGFIYSVAFMEDEKADEMFIIIINLMIQLYLSILIWSSIVKMTRNESVTYMRQEDV